MTRLGRVVRVLRNEGLWGLVARLHAQIDGVRQSSGPLDKWPRASGSEFPRAGDFGAGILVIDHRVPRGDVTAGDAAAIELLRDLRFLGYEVTFLPRFLANGDSYGDVLRRLGVEVVERGMGYQTARQFVAARAREFSAILISRLAVAESFLPAVRRVAPQAITIFHCPDLQFLREQREAVISGSVFGRKHAHRTRTREMAIVRAADHVVAISDVEASILSQEIPASRVSVCGILHVPVSECVPAFERRRNVCFLGGFSHRPNVDAVVWFASEVWPAVLARLPDIEFHILGADMPRAVASLARRPGIRAPGYVKDLKPAFDEHRVGVAPLRFGAGIKGKLAVMLGAGLPCVATNVAVEGMGLRDGRDVLVHDDPASFADAVISLYECSDIWERLSREGRNAVAASYGAAARRAALVGMLARAGMTGPGGTP